MVFGGDFYGLSPWLPSKRKKMPGKRALCPPAEGPAAPQAALVQFRRHEPRNISVILGPLPHAGPPPRYLLIFRLALDWLISRAWATL